MVPFGSPGSTAERPRSGPGALSLNVAACRSTRRRAVRSSGSTRSRVTLVTCQPRSRAMSCASRPFRSIPLSIACMSGTTDLISMTSNDPVAAWNARMSIEPRSPLDVERHFGGDKPVRGGEQREGALDEVGVTRIEQPVETLALPQQPHVDPRPECGRDADQDVHRDPVGVPALDPPDSRAARPAPFGRVRPGSSRACDAAP